MCEKQNIYMEMARPYMAIDTNPQPPQQPAWENKPQPLQQSAPNGQYLINNC